MGQILLQLWSCTPLELAGSGDTALTWGRGHWRKCGQGKRLNMNSSPQLPLSFLKVNPELQQLQWLGKGFPWRAGRMFWGGTGGVQVLCADWGHPDLGTRDVGAAGARLDFLVVLELMLSAAQMRRLYFLTPTSVFTSLYLLELKGLFH